jgi:hypothetical protein
VTEGTPVDGRWWLSISEDERVGFLEGYLGCYLNDAKGTVKFVESTFTYEQRFSNYLQSNLGEQSKPVDEILLKIAALPYAQRDTVPPGGQEWEGKYGYLDGDYWRRSQQPHRLGLVQGFLHCYSRHVELAQDTFSKPVSSYVEAISNWYGVRANDPGEIDMQRIRVKIPEALFRFKD